MHKKYGKENDAMKTENIALELSSHERNGFGHIWLRPVKLSTATINDREVEVIRYFDDFVFDGEAMFHQLWITCQYDTGGDRSPYAFRVEYRDGGIQNNEVEKAKMKLKYIMWLNKRIAKWEDENGGIANDGFGLYVKRIANLMGIKNFVLPESLGFALSNAPKRISRCIAKVVDETIATGEINRNYI